MMMVLKKYQLVRTDERLSDKSDTSYGAASSGSSQSLHGLQISPRSTTANTTAHGRDMNSINVMDCIQSHWKYGLMLLGIYGFFIEMKPSEPYLTPYLVEEKQFTIEEINNSIYPYWTYAQLITVFFVPLMAKFITPKRMFYLETLGFLMTRAFLIWGSSLFAMQLMQLTYAIGTSVKSIYYCYMYLIFEQKHFGTVTGFVWGAQAFGTCMSGIIGQLLVNANVSYLSLNYISMGSVCIAFFLAFLIPEKKYGSRQEVIDIETSIQTEEDLGFVANDVVETSAPNDIVFDHKSSIGYYVSMVADEYVQVFHLFRDRRGPMAFNWILTKCVAQLVGNYASILWYSLSDDPQFYGAAISLYQGIGVIGALLPVFAGVIVEDQKLQSSLVHIFQGIAIIGIQLSLVLMTVTNEIWMMYVAFISFGFFYYVFITGLSCSMASDSQPLEHVFVFAANLFCAALIETIITLILSNINAKPKIWFTVVCVVQGITIPVYFYRSLKCKPRTCA